MKDNSIYKNGFSNSIHCSLHIEIKCTNIPNRKYSILRQQEEEVAGKPLPPATMLSPQVLYMPKEITPI